jgi:hypothetical protein
VFAAAAAVDGMAPLSVGVAVVAAAVVAAAKMIGRLGQNHVGGGARGHTVVGCRGAVVVVVVAVAAAAAAVGWWSLGWAEEDPTHPRRVYWRRSFERGGRRPRDCSGVRSDRWFFVWKEEWVWKGMTAQKMRVRGDEIKC